MHTLQFLQKAQIHSRVLLKRQSFEKMTEETVVVVSKQPQIHKLFSKETSKCEFEPHLR
jgi:hypothetical protein